MQWISRQHILPILIGISVTGVGAGLLYFLLTQDERSGNSSGGRIERSRQSQIECKIPRQCVPAIIGRGGATIKDLQNKTGTYMRFQDDNVECPERVCVIRGKPESICLAEAMIKNIIANQPIIETYEVNIPQKAVGRIMGRGGETVQQIQMSTSAKIIIDNFLNDNTGERRVIIKGTAEQIAAALSQIEDKVREEMEARSILDASYSSRLPRGKLSPRNTAVNNVENATKTQETPTVEGASVNGLMEVYVSAMESPSQFWVQVVGPGTIALDKLILEMTVYYNDEENQELHVLKEVTVGQMVAAKFSYDDKWYRAEVLSTSNDDRYIVYFVDYGDQEDVNADSILSLRTDFLSLRLQAIECSLANVKSRDPEWSTEACERFAALTSLAEWRILIAKVRGYKERTLGHGRSRREGSPIPCVDLYDKNGSNEVDVGRELIKEGFAESEEGQWSTASSTLSLSRRSHDQAASPTPASTPPLSRRALSPETPAAAASTPTRPKTIVEIDLTTPQKFDKQIQQIDLVTPAKNETGRFIDNEKRALENGSGDMNTVKSYDRKPGEDKSQGFVPAGYESDVSGDSEGFEMG